MLPFTEPVLSRRYCNNDTTVLQYRMQDTEIDTGMFFAL